MPCKYTVLCQNVKLIRVFITVSGSGMAGLLLVLLELVIDTIFPVMEVGVGCTVPMNDAVGSMPPELIMLLDCCL